MKAYVSQEDRRALKALQQLPGVGPSIAADLLALGYRHPHHLKGQDPEQMYDRSNALRGMQQDRCLLYVFRCAVHNCVELDPDPEKRKWWRWMDRHLERER